MNFTDCKNKEEEEYVEAETISNDDSEKSSLYEFCNLKLKSLAFAVGERMGAMQGKCLVVEPFFGGSHKQLIDVLREFLKDSFEFELFTLPAKKWHWRARTSSLYFSEAIPRSITHSVLFCSSVLNLAELLGLRPDLSRLFKVIYFHENQLEYPVRNRKERDFQYGYNQVLSALVADVVIFNSRYNLESFVSRIDRHFKLQPDFRPRGLKEKIVTKSRVIYFPICEPDRCVISLKPNVLHIVWPHRWEHDKNPEMFFETLLKLKERNCRFCVSVLGESFSRVPEIFDAARSELEDRILNWGRLESELDYHKCLKSGHVVVSTAHHEFFGVAMMEAVSYGCFPLACNRLVYREIYPKMCLYNTPQQLYKKLKMFCEKPYLTEVYLKEANVDLEKFYVGNIMGEFANVFRNAKCK